MAKEKVEANAGDLDAALRTFYKLGWPFIPLKQKQMIVVAAEAYLKELNLQEMERQLQQHRELKQATQPPKKE